MEFEQLEAFLTLIKTKNFTRAAEELNVVQSTITARIKMLEQTVGKELFKRRTRSVEITPAGESLLPYVEQVMEVMQNGLTTARLQPDFESRLVIGSVNSIWDSSLFTKLNQFRRQHKRMAIRLITDHSNHISQRIQNGTVDVGLVYIPPKATSIEVIPVRDESLQPVGTPTLANQLEGISAKELLHLPFIHFNWGSPFEEWFEQEVGSHDAAAFRVDHTGIAVRLLLQGEGAGFLLDSIAEEYIKENRLQPISIKTTNAIPKRTIYVIFKKKNRDSKKITAFLDHFLIGEY